MQSRLHVGTTPSYCSTLPPRHGWSSTASKRVRHAEVASPLRLKPSVYQPSSANWAFSSHKSSKISTLSRRTTKCSATSTAIGVGVFFTPSIIAVIYAYFKGKGNVKDGLSRLLTEVTQGYFQPNVGGESIPVAQGELSDLAGDEPLFKALYQW